MPSNELVGPIILHAWSAMRHVKFAAWHASNDLVESYDVRVVKKLEQTDLLC